MQSHTGGGLAGQDAQEVPGRYLNGEQELTHQLHLEPGLEILPGVCPSLFSNMSLLRVEKGGLEAGGWNSQSSTQGELGKGALQPSTPAPFPPPLHSLAPVGTTWVQI